jgi:hypothetical protein
MNADQKQERTQRLLKGFPQGEFVFRSGRLTVTRQGENVGALGDFAFCTGFSWAGFSPYLNAQISFWLARSSAAGSLM